MWHSFQLPSVRGLIPWIFLASGITVQNIKIDIYCKTQQFA